MQRSKRPWYTSFILLPRTAARTMSMLQHHRLGAFVPFLMFLLVGSVVLWLVNAIAPLAPFVYSLF
mgnify:CR=1 FL=1